MNNFLTVFKKVELLPYVPRPFIPFTEMSDDEIFNGSGDLIFDSECYPNYFLAAFKHIQSGKIITISPPFDQRKLSFILQRYRCIGFNSIKYDIPLLWAAYKNQDTKFLKRVSNDLVSGDWWQEVAKQHEFVVFPTTHLDLIEVAPLRGSLKLYGARLHTQRIQEIPYHHMKELTDYEKEVVEQYCIHGDLPATELLFNNLQEQLKLREELSIQYKIDVMSKSDAQIAESVIGTELKKITGKWPSKPKLEAEGAFSYECPQFIEFQTPVLWQLLEKVKAVKYRMHDTGRLIGNEELSVKIGEGIYRLGSGGLHSSEKGTTIVSTDEIEIIDRDVASYYPAIALALELYPEHIGPDFLTVYKTIVERRLAAKKAKNIAISECLKITINGTFGKTGSPYSILYAPKMMIQITVTGQLALLMLIEALELSAIPVYSANTDGIVIACPKDKKELMDQIIKWWENKTSFTTEETKYKAVYSRDVNAYLSVKDNDEVKGKNIYYDPWRGKTAKDGYWRFQKNPNAQICIEAIETLILYGIPLDTTIEQCADITKFVCVKNVKGGAHKDRTYLGRVIRWYYAKGIVGTIQYIESGNNVPDTEGAKPCMDLPAELPKDINYPWYIEKAREMLFEMNYLKRPRQISFFT